MGWTKESNRASISKKEKKVESVMVTFFRSFLPLNIKSRLFGSINCYIHMKPQGSFDLNFPGF